MHMSGACVLEAFIMLKSCCSLLLKLSGFFDIRQRGLTNVNILREICGKQFLSWNTDAADANC